MIVYLSSRPTMKNKLAQASRTSDGRRQELPHVVRRVFLFVGLASMLVLAPARANELADVSKLLKAGKVPEALGRTNDFLAKHPADPQMRFMKGVLLTEQNKSDEAILIFTKLTEDYKDLPEPYNNLAVLHAANGQYEKARIALEKAIRTNPSYMTAYENLGDVYGKMASQAYDKALALGTATPPAKSKLTMLHNFSSSTGSKAPEHLAQSAPIAAPAPAPAAARVAGNAPVQLISPLPADAGKLAPPQRIPALSVSPPPAVANKAAPAVAAPPVKADPAKPAAVPVLAKIEAAKPLAAPIAVKAEPAKPPAAPASTLAKAAPAATVTAAAKPSQPPPGMVFAQAEVPKPAPAVSKAEAVKPAAPAPKAAADGEREAALALLHGWAKAWTAQNVEGYLAYYSNDFAPPKGLSRKAWADERRARIAGKGRIRVEVSAAQVALSGDTAKVSFRQSYESDRLSANTRKTLVLVKNGGKWQIKQESSGS
ncbi:tetratricopeptide repeat protein [Rugamonas sp. DEMB1]|uniref:L,D-transpeptidase Cds6 family protein n=1 Tax=Rugamonas sp. DEMB1 TaxID=3039386 RepID=UPI00244CE0DB|nr:tetratricopeptide repeat protein [Rugamonas sp. DEMB1]WGG50773.1 tetratricopeptide repeat protein [Rugamonas sp. DEMB1]